MTKIICISGKAQHGKDTAAQLLYEELTNNGNKVLMTHYADLLKYICKSYFNWDGNKDETGRTILQKVGTDVVRVKQPDFWIDFIIQLLTLFPDEWDYVIIPDTRFPNEVHKWKTTPFESIHIRVQRPNFKSPLSQEQQQHLSETALDNEDPDFWLINSGTIESLRIQVKNACVKI